jgi:uncharacterized protein (TIGR03118 family)
VRPRLASYFATIFLFGFLLAAANLRAQTVAYRQTNLTSNLPNVANNIFLELVNPWGIAFLPGQPFFVADNAVGRASSHDAAGAGVLPGGFTLPNADHTGFDTPTGIVADPNSSFGNSGLIKPFILVTDQGTVFTWGPDARGDLPSAATLVINSASTGAVYKGVAILNSSLTAPALAVTDFHGGFIDTFLPGFSPVALPGSFADPNLPLGYAPFGIQVIGRQVFVTYAVQDTAKRDPVFAAGKGIVDIFDLDGNFVRRFATGGSLNAPWGVTEASASFGPFSNDILIGNVGDGTISAFDSATGRFIGKLSDGDGRELTEIGLHGMAFRPDGFANANTLYFTSEVTSRRDGLFGAIATGLVSTTRVSVPTTPTEAPVTITVEVSAGPGNRGTPTGSVVVRDGDVVLATPALSDGVATFTTTLTGVGAHAIAARYRGDTIFLPSSSQTEAQVTGLATTLVLTAPANANPGAAITLTASVTSSGGIPTGQIVFHDGNTNLGSSLLNASGVAVLRVDTLASGIHSLTASYAGDDKFSSSTSAAVTIDIASPDFSLAASPTAASVIAGQSAQFVVTVSPVGGFANNVTLSCSPTAGITCVFSPATVATARGAANANLTVATSRSAAAQGTAFPALIRLCAFFLAIAGIGLANSRRGLASKIRVPLLGATAAASLAAFSWLAVGCGGAAGNSTNHHTASIVLTAQSGTISHSTTVNVTLE